MVTTRPQVRKKNQTINTKLVKTKESKQSENCTPSISPNTSQVQTDTRKPRVRKTANKPPCRTARIETEQPYTPPALNPRVRLNQTKYDNFEPEIINITLPGFDLDRCMIQFVQKGVMFSDYFYSIIGNECLCERVRRWQMGSKD
ncbi:hypothetical protein GCK72_024789 [Caenorhabditis remanei]|nr:hypothetical protein GCK72_024789 [Caenorhabditis remanei]KAF1748322.1 hypothetical protein GCK72_024789 [Caenorhabditis remanei]